MPFPSSDLGRLGHLNNPDPLGISLKERARQHRARLNPTGLGEGFGPLRDSSWDAFLQAMDEAGVDKLADESAGIQRGMFPERPPETTFATHPGGSAVFDIYGQGKGHAPLVFRRPSRHIGRSNRPIQQPSEPSLQGILSATRRR